MIALVGSTGFVGGNLAESAQFDGLYNSKNIESAFGTQPDLLIYAGLRAEKYLAEQFPAEDAAQIETAKENIKKIAPKRLVLISTIDVYEDSFHAAENTPALGNGAYGKHRADLESWVRANYPNVLIVRLPGLFGKGIKKNFIFDYIRYIPALLNEAKFTELSAKESGLKDFYRKNEKGFYACKPLSKEETVRLKGLFQTLGFSALNFTDSRGLFQYYYLGRLYSDICTALDHNISVLNITAEPVTVAEIYRSLTGKDFVNIIKDPYPVYDARTLYYEQLGGFAAKDGIGGYLLSKAEVLKEIQLFVNKEQSV